MHQELYFLQYHHQITPNVTKFLECHNDKKNHHKESFLYNLRHKSYLKEKWEAETSMKQGNHMIICHGRSFYLIVLFPCVEKVSRGRHTLFY